LIKKSNHTDKIAFLFGAGISIPAKIPNTKEISEIILNSKEINRGGAENYFFGAIQSWNIYKDLPERVRTFLTFLRDEIENYYNDKDRIINYEDIFYLLDFIEYNFYEPEGNPAFKYIFKEFEPKIKNLLTPLDTFFEHSFDMNSLLSESKKYIKQILSKLLARKAESFVGFNFLKEALLKKDLKKVDIFTLNHDIVLERFFKINNLTFNDGFQKNINDIETWNPKLFNNEDRIKLYKIHGSINWQYCDQYSWEDNRITKIRDIERFDTIANALILIGTHNKMSNYIQDLYLELYYRFYQALNMHNILIVAGYGFNDRGINQKIFNWLFNPSKKILIIDPNVEEKKIKFHSALLSEWDKNNRIIKISDYVENVTWNEIQTKLEQLRQSTN